MEGMYHTLSVSRRHCRVDIRRLPFQSAVDALGADSIVHFPLSGRSASLLLWGLSLPSRCCVALVAAAVVVRLPCLVAQSQVLVAMVVQVLVAYLQEDKNI